MFQAVLSHALCGDAPVLRELGIDTGTLAGPPRIRYAPLPGSWNPDLSMVIEPRCE
jgi:hypothetical protein